MLAKRERGTFLDPQAGRITFREYFDDWSSRQIWEATTVKQMRYATGCVTFGDVPLARIRRSHIEQWVKSLSKTHAPATIRGRLRSVRSVFRAAVRDQIIASDPCEGVAAPRQRRSEAAMVIPTDEQVSALLKAAEPSFRAFVALCAFAGLRQGEAAGTQMGDIDFLGRKLHVRRQVQIGEDGKLEVRPPKYQSERVIHIPDALVMLLAQHCELLATVDRTWLSASQDGGPVHENTTRYRWNKTCERAGVSGFGLHALRHYFASSLLSAGVDVVAVSKAMGHATASTTLSVYAHIMPSAEERSRAAIGAAMSSVFGTNQDPRSANNGLTSS